VTYCSVSPSLCRPVHHSLLPPHLFIPNYTACLLERLLVKGFAKADKELRNDVLVVVSLLADRPANAEHFCTSGLLSLLLLYSTAPEMELPVSFDVLCSVLLCSLSRPIGHSLLPPPLFILPTPLTLVPHLTLTLTLTHTNQVDAESRNFSSAEPADLSLKRMAWSLVARLARASPKALDIVLDSRYMDALLLHLLPSSAESRHVAK
jgi:hypothetical protein